MILCLHKQALVDLATQEWSNRLDPEHDRAGISYLNSCRLVQYQYQYI